MSSLANLPYGVILDYWYERLQNSSCRKRFLFTKVFEIISFKSNSVKPQNPTNKKNIESLFHVDFSSNEVPIRPKVSVVVPAYISNDFDLFCLKRLIKYLLKQTISPDHIIVVDDSSPIHYSINSCVELIKMSTNNGPAKARNIGVENALSKHSDLILFTDVDCVPSPDWIEAIVTSYQKDPKCNIVSGNTKSFNRNWLGVYHEINGTLNGRVFKERNQLLYGPTCNLSITRQVAEKLRFNENFPNAAGEDIEFCFQAIQSNFKISHCQDAIIKHDYGYGKNPIKNLRKFWKQFAKYGRGETVLLEKVPDYYSYFNETLEIAASKSA